MKKQLLCVVALAATFGLSVAGVHAQDVAENASTQMVSAVPAEPVAAPAPKPQFLSDSNGKFVFFAGYSFLDTNITEGNDGVDDCNNVCFGRTAGHGFDLSGTYMLNPNFGLTADFSGNYGGVSVVDDGDKYHLTQNSYYILFGPTVSKSVGKITLSAHGLAGIARLWAAEDYVSGGSNTREDTLPWATGFAIGLGGSADWRLSRKFGWRVAQVDWLWSDGTQSFGYYSEHVPVSAVRLSTGIVFNFGGMR